MCCSNSLTLPLARTFPLRSSGESVEAFPMHTRLSYCRVGHSRLAQKGTLGESKRMCEPQEASRTDSKKSPKDLTSIVASVACWRTEQCICHAGARAHNIQIDREERMGPKAWGEGTSSNAIFQKRTSSDKITGKSDTTNAHSPTAFATSSNLTLVQNVWPTRGGEKGYQADLSLRHANRRAFSSPCVTMGIDLAPSQQSISTCLKPVSSWRRYESALLRPVS